MSEVRAELAAPVTPMDLEVSGYAAMYIGDPNDAWVVELVHEWDDRPSSPPAIHALTTQFRLRHVGTGCYLW